MKHNGCFGRFPHLSKFGDLMWRLTNTGAVIFAALVLIAVGLVWAWG